MKGETGTFKKEVGEEEEKNGRGEFHKSKVKKGRK